MTILVIENYDGSVHDTGKKEQFRYVNYKTLLSISNNELADLLMGTECLILSGGPQHIPHIKNHPELLKEMILIDVAIQKRITIIGICLGFQLLNYYFGNTVITLDECIVGCNKMNPASVNTHEDPLLERIDFKLLSTGFSFHYDGVKVNQNPDLLVIARDFNDNIYFIKHAMYPIYGIQSHPEVSYDETLNCLKKYGVSTNVDIPEDRHLKLIRETFFGALLNTIY